MFSAIICPVPTFIVLGRLAAPSSYTELHNFVEESMFGPSHARRESDSAKEPQEGTSETEGLETGVNAKFAETDNINSKEEHNEGKDMSNIKDVSKCYYENYPVVILYT